MKDSMSHAPKEMQPDCFTGNITSTEPSKYGACQTCVKPAKGNKWSFPDQRSRVKATLMMHKDTSNTHRHCLTCKVPSSDSADLSEFMKDPTHVFMPKGVVGGYAVNSG